MPATIPADRRSGRTRASRTSQPLSRDKPRHGSCRILNTIPSRKIPLAIHPSNNQHIGQTTRTAFHAVAYVTSRRVSASHAIPRGTGHSFSTHAGGSTLNSLQRIAYRCTQVAKYARVFYSPGKVAPIVSNDPARCRQVVSPYPH